MVEQMLVTLSENPLWQGSMTKDSILFDLLESLLENNNHESAAQLLELALYSREKGNYSLFIHDHSFIVDHLDEYAEEYRNNDPIAFIDSLEAAIAAEYKTRFGRDALTPPEGGTSPPLVPHSISDVSAEDGTSVMPDNKNGRIRCKILAELRDSLLKLAQLQNEPIHNRLNKYLSSELVFIKIAFCVIEEYPHRYSNLAVKALTDPELRRLVFPNFEPLLTASAPTLSNEQASKVLRKLDDELIDTFDSTESKDKHLHRALSKAELNSETLPEPFVERLRILDSKYERPEFEEEENSEESKENKEETHSDTWSSENSVNIRSSHKEEPNSTTTTDSHSLSKDFEGFYEELSWRFQCPNIKEAENISFDDVEQVAGEDSMIGFDFGRHLPTYVSNRSDPDDSKLNQLLPTEYNSGEGGQFQLAVACGFITVCPSDQSGHTIGQLSSGMWSERIESALISVLDEIDEIFESSKLSGPVYGLGEWLVFLTVVYNKSPSELQAVEKFFHVTDRDDSRPGSWLVPEGFRRITGSEGFPDDVNQEQFID